MDADDPLIPPPDDTPFERPAPDTDALEAAFSHAFDYMNMHAIAWPARDASGRLVPPPDEHVLDALARMEDLVPDEVAQVRPAAGTVAVIPALPDCDLCDKPARYDATLTLNGKNMAAFACPDCYGKHGGGTLGATGDVYLMATREVPSQVRAVCNELTSRLKRAPLFA